MPLPRLLAAATLALATLSPTLTACSTGPGSGPDTGPDTAAPAAATTGSEAPAWPTHVLAISVDGLGSAALEQLGPDGAPTLHRLLTEGAGTLNARTEVEQTVTLPNHASMMTGRRIDATRGGHGVTWDHDRPRSTVQKGAGHPVASIFSTVHAAGGSTALYSTKSKFALYDRSWPRGIDLFRVRENQRRLVAMARADLADGAPEFTFLHVSLPDRFGHQYGGLSAEYLAAVERTDAQLGSLVRALAGTDVAVILTADHGFAAGVKDHSGRRNIQNYRIPFLVWGDGVATGDLYAMNDGFADPGTTRTTYAGKQPVRNGDVANLAASLLGLDAVPGSGIHADQSLTVSD
ncbi:alkaline phosphatase family protein [Nocardioides sp. T2.26MG-1]|uniref:alkaline phosphatase family protein n=1 Tax=Nocardioides sp. T2.26MG-1 TaxID=3041166 RepID=UPI0024776F30|nr:alkaline phosphatase family protein [Nocardioides sp. T2.26MG-1]CAI9408847.1 2,3-bisphosphoglycerate-independent phosphoglycerate mutase [Nocardioides sp. T2.26MG-1]